MTDTAAATDVRPARLIFSKLIVRDLPAMIGFYERAFGLTKVRDIEMPGLKEAILQRSADDKGPSLVLYHHTDGRDVVVGTAHGPVGFAVADVDAAYAKAIAEGATSGRAPFNVPGMRIAFVFDPEGHELELVRFGA